MNEEAVVLRVLELLNKINEKREKKGVTNEKQESR